MKYLSHYIENEQSRIFERHGAFFAFTRYDFEKKSVSGVKYASSGSGLIAPVDNWEQLVQDLDECYQRGVDKDFKENGKDGVIKRELENYESYYIGSCENAIEALKPYKEISEEDIRSAFSAGMSNPKNYM